MAGSQGEPLLFQLFTGHALNRTPTQRICSISLSNGTIETLVDSGSALLDGIAVDDTKGKIYWTNDTANRIYRANWDGAEVETVVALPPGTLESVELDLVNEKLYWTDWGTNRIQRANLDGSNVQDLVTTGLVNPWGLALDLANGKMYWTDFGTDKIQRANLDGSQVENLVTSADFPRGIALDIASGKMYWTQDGAFKGIMRANLDGTHIEQLIDAGNVQFVLDIAVNLEARQLYWVDDVRIMSADLDGQNIEPVHAVPETLPHGIALDLDRNRFYWADYGARMIRRSNFDGSNVEDLATTDLRPEGIVFDALTESMYWSEPNFPTPFSLGNGVVRRSDLNGQNVQDILVSNEYAFGAMAIDDAHRQLYVVVDEYFIFHCNMDGTNGQFIISTGRRCEGIAIDSQASKLYFSTEGYIDGITVHYFTYRSNLDGTGIETLMSGREAAKGLALDPASGRLYWSSYFLDVLWQANLDGSDAEYIVRSAPGGHWDVDVDPRVPGDCNVNRTFDPSDIGSFTSCLTGPGQEFVLGCSCADVTGNGRVDLKDFADLQRGGFFGCTMDLDCQSLVGCYDSICVDHRCEQGEFLCTAPTPACDESTDTCVECITSLDCPALRPACQTSIHTCVECLSSNDCSSPRPACDANTNLCVECLTSADCAAPFPACHASTQTCVECVSSADCAAPEPVCKTGTNLCVQCLTDQDCPSEPACAPICRSVDHACFYSCGH